jgi:hypothetical protein
MNKVFPYERGCAQYDDDRWKFPGIDVLNPTCSLFGVLEKKKTHTCLALHVLFHLCQHASNVSAPARMRRRTSPYAPARISRVSCYKYAVPPLSRLTIPQRYRALSKVWSSCACEKNRGMYDHSFRTSLTYTQISASPLFFAIKSVFVAATNCYMYVTTSRL